MSAQDKRQNKGTLVVAVDFSDHSRRALEAATRLAKDLSWNVVLVHVHEPVPYPQAVSQRTVDAIQQVQAEIAEDEAITLTTDWAEGVRDKGVSVESHMLEGEPHREIIKQADRIDAGMIVVGTHGRGGLKEWIGGSVAKELLKHAHRPVLLIPPAGNK